MHVNYFSDSWKKEYGRFKNKLNEKIGTGKLQYCIRNKKVVRYLFIV